MNVKISIIIVYKNRDTERVQHALDSIADQTLKDLEVVFIDYGSDEIYRTAIQTLVESYSFAKYYYNDSRGMPWNRSHSINTGIRLASSDYVLLGDIDWVYSPGTLEAMLNAAEENVRVYSRNYLLPENIPFNNSLFANVPAGLPVTNENGGGGAHLIHKMQLEKIRGFDEYYCFWGVEDRDLYSRLDQMGIKTFCLDIKKYPVFHQWHPEASGAKKGFFPDRWWESMNIHFQLNKKKLKRNDEGWGRLLTKEDRKVFNCKEINFEYNDSGSWFYKGNIAALLISDLQSLKDNECLRIEIRKNKKAKSRKPNKVNRFLNTLSGKTIHEKNKADKFYADTDLLYIIWRLIKEENFIGDYFISEEIEKTIIKLMTRRISNTG